MAMDDCERQKKLTFVLQLLEDLHHFHGSSIHKCDCEICDKKSSLIHSSITRAIQEVNLVSQSLSVANHHALPGTHRDQEFPARSDSRQVLNCFQLVGNSSPVFSGLYDNKTVVSPCSYEAGQNTKDVRCLDRDGVSVDAKEQHDGCRLKVPNAETSESMLSSTQRDSGVLCENLLQSHSISPIRSVVDEVEQNNEPSPNCSDASITTTRKTDINPHEACGQKVRAKTSELDTGCKQIITGAEVFDGITTQIKQTRSVTPSVQFDNQTSTTGPPPQPPAVLSSLFPISPMFYNQFPIPTFPSSHQTSPTIGWIPAAFYPVSLVPNSNNPHNIQSLSSLFKSNQLDSSPCIFSENIEPSRQNSHFLGKPPMYPGESTSQSQNTPQDKDSVLSVAELLKNMQMSNPNQEDDVQTDCQSSLEKRPEKHTGKADDSIQKMLLTSSSTCTESCENVNDDFPSAGACVSTQKNVEGTSQHCQLSQDGSIIGNKNVLLSDARLLSQEEECEEGSSSVMEGSRLSDSYMWRPWEVKDDIYRILSDSSIGEEDVDDDDDDDCERKKEQEENLECKGNNDGGVCHKKNERRPQSPFVNKVDKNVNDRDNSSLLLSPCKKTRRNVKENVVYCDRDSSGSSDDSLGIISEGQGHTAIKSLCKKMNGKQDLDTFSLSEDSELDSFDAALDGECRNYFVTSNSRLSEEKNIDSKSVEHHLESGIETFSRRDGAFSEKSLVVVGDGESVPCVEICASERTGSPKAGSKQRKKLKSRKSLFDSSWAGLDCKENKVVVSSPLSRHSKENLEIMSLKDMSNKSLNTRNFLSERKEAVNVKSDLEMNMLKNRCDNKKMIQPEIIVTNVDKEEILFPDKDGKDDRYPLSGLGKNNLLRDKSVLEVLIGQPESHSFCNVPCNSNSPKNDNVHDSTSPSCKAGRIHMKTFPPKRKSKQVFVKSTQEESTQSSQNVPSAKDIPAVGTASSSNKLQTSQNISCKSEVKLSEGDDDDKSGRNSIVINGVSKNSLACPVVKYTDDEIENCHGVAGEKTTEQKNVCRPRTKENILPDVEDRKSVRVSQKFVGQSGANPGWGGPAISHWTRDSSKDKKGPVEKVVNHSHVLPGSLSTVVVETEHKVVDDPEEQLLWKRFGNLHLGKDASNLNKSLPVAKSGKDTVQRGCERKDDLESYEANQSFPRMAEGQRSGNSVVEGQAGRSIGTQNLAFDNIHQSSSTPSTLKGRDIGLVPRNRRSVFGFSPPNGGGIDSPNRDHQCLQSQQSSPPLLDRMWPVFDVSARFSRPPELDEILFNCVSSSICVVDTRRHGKIVSVNESFQQLVGIHEKILGLKISRFIKVKSHPSELAVSTPQMMVLSDGTLTRISGKLVSCMTTRGEEVPVSMWGVPVSRQSSSDDKDDVKLFVCVIGLVLPLPGGIYLSKCGQDLVENRTPSQEVMEFKSLTPCGATGQTGLLMVDLEGCLQAWDLTFFDLFMGQCDFNKKDHLSKYLSDITKICNPGEDTSCNSSDSRQSQNSPCSRNHILSGFGGEVCFLKESDRQSGDDKDCDDVPDLLLPVGCFSNLEGSCGYDDDDDDEDNDDGVLSGDADHDDRVVTRGNREEKSFSLEAAAVESMKLVGNARNKCKGMAPTTSTPCKKEGIGEQISDTARGDRNQSEDDGKGCVGMDTGIYSARFHSQFDDWFAVTFKLGIVQTRSKGTLFCLWFSINEEAVDDDGDDDYLESGSVDDDDDDEEEDCVDDYDDSIGDRSHMTESVHDEKEAMKTLQVAGQKRLNQLRNGPGQEVSLGQLMTDQAGLNQSLNATVGEDTLDLEQAVLGSFCSKYRILETLGQGSFGFVRRAFPLSQEVHSVVVKFIKKSSMLEDSWQWLTSAEEQVPIEVAMLQTLDHDNIVKLLDVHQNDHFVQMVMEDFASLDLFDFIDQVSIDEMLACHLFTQIAHAVDYLHSKSILHRDIKDENVIINASFHCKLIDFGSATYFLPPGQMFDKFRGTLEYCSPEVHLHRGYRGPELDAWALGVTLYTIVFRENPYTADVVPHQMSVHDLPYTVSLDLAHVLFGLLCCDPDKRFTVAKVVACPWVTQDVDVSTYKWDDLFSCEFGPADNVEY